MEGGGGLCVNNLLVWPKCYQALVYFYEVTKESCWFWNKFGGPEKWHRTKASVPGVWQGSWAGRRQIQSSEFPTFPAYRNLCGETREGEMPHILRVTAPERWELCHMLCGWPVWGNCLLDDIYQGFSIRVSGCPHQLPVLCWGHGSTDK